MRNLWFLVYRRLMIERRSPPPEFGLNGAVLNTPSMGERLRAEYRGEKVLPAPMRRTRSSALLFCLAVLGVLTLRTQANAPFLLPLLFAAAFYLADFLRSVWSDVRGRREAAAWAITGPLGLVITLLIASWAIAPVQPFWARIVISLIACGYGVRQFWRVGRFEGWLWFAVLAPTAGLLMWATWSS